MWRHSLLKFRENLEFLNFLNISCQFVGMSDISGNTVVILCYRMNVSGQDAVMTVLLGKHR